MKTEKQNKKKEKRKGRIWKKKKVWICVLAVFLIAGFLFFVGRPGNGRQKTSQSVKSETAGKGTIRSVIEGSGNLDAAETLDVQVPTGIRVEEIKVETGDQVEKGQVLAKLNKTSITSSLVDVEKSLDDIEDTLDEDDDLSDLETEELEEKRSELKSVKKKLEALRKNPVVKASADGIIGAVNITENTEITQTGTVNTGTSEGVSSTVGKAVNESAAVRLSAGVKLAAAPLSAETVVVDGGKEAAAQAKAGITGQSEEITAEEKTEEKTEEKKEEITEETTEAAAAEETTEDTKKNTGNISKETTETGETTETEKYQIIRDYSSLTVETPAAGKKPQSRITSTKAYSGTITWNLKGNVFESGKEYTAVILLTAKSGYTFSEKSLPSFSNASCQFKVSGSGEGNQLKITARFGETGEEKGITMPETNGQQKLTGGLGGGVSVSSGTSAMTSDTGSTSSNAEYNEYETTAFQIQKQENVLVKINVDELDILSVQKGQTATVVLDADEEEIYEGEVTKVANVSSSDSGNAKYQVEIELPMEENMKLGMSATATIQIEQAVDVLVISMSALQEKGERTFVYTSQEKDGTLSGETEVETGLSDGEQVEIVSGLKEGDTVYYTRSAGEENSFDMNVTGGFPGSGGGENSGKGPSSGGEKPDKGNSPDRQ